MLMVILMRSHEDNIDVQTIAAIDDAVAGNEDSRDGNFVTLYMAAPADDELAVRYATKVVMDDNRDCGLGFIHVKVGIKGPSKKVFVRLTVDSDFRLELKGIIKVVVESMMLPRLSYECGNVVRNTNHKQTTSQPQANHKRTTSEPQANHKQNKSRTQTNLNAATLLLAARGTILLPCLSTLLHR